MLATTGELVVHMCRGGLCMFHARRDTCVGMFAQSGEYMSCIYLAAREETVSNSLPEV